jgi:hypothetical protein
VEVTGAPFPRRRLAGDTLLRVPGDNSRRDQAQETQHDTGNPAGHTRGWTRARLGRIDGEGGSGWRTSPASGVPGARKDPGLRHLVHKLWGKVWCSPGACGSRCCSGGWPATRSRGGRDWALAGSGDAGAIQAVDRLGPAQGVPVEVYKESAEPERHRRRAIAAADRLTREGPFGKFHRHRGVELQCGARGALGRRGGALAGDVVVWGEGKRPDHGEAEVTGAGKGKSGGAGDLRAVQG